MQVGELMVKISLDTSKLQSDLAAVEAKLKGLGGSLSDLTKVKGFSDITASSKQLKDALAGALPVADQLKARLQEQQTQYGVLGARLADVTTKYGATSKQAQALELAMQKLSNNINQTKTALENAGNAGAKVTADIKNVGASADDSGNKVKSFGAYVKDALATAGGMLLAQGIQAVGSALTNAVGTAADFEHALSGVSAVAGGLSDTTLESLRQKALQIGADTSLSASQAVSAFEALIANGVKVDANFNTIADATVALAEATGGNLTTAANVATDAMAQFGISASEIGDVINGVVGVTVAGKFGIDDYRLALANAGSVAGSMGVSLTDFNTVLAGTSYLFASGSDAGTAYKTFLVSLTGSSETAKTAMRELGIITADGANQFFTSGGAMKSMDQVTSILAESMKGLTKEQEISYLKTIFGVDAYRMAAGAMDLAGQSADGTGTKFEQLANDIAKINAAEQAKTRLDNFSGAMEALKGSAETVAIVIAGPLLNAITPLVQSISAGVGAFGMFANSILSAENPLQALLSAIDSVIPGFADLANQAIAWGSNIVNQFTAGIMASLGPLISAMQYIGSVISSWLRPGSPPKITPNLDQWGAEAATVYYDGWSQGDYSALQEIGNVIQSTLSSMIDAGASAMGKDGIIPMVMGSQSAISEAINQLNETGNVGEEAIQKIVDSAGDAGPAIAGVIESYFDLQEATLAVANAQDELNSVTEEYASKLDPLNEQLQAINDQQQAIKNKEKLEKLNKTLADGSATEAEREDARLEIQKMAIQDQIKATEKEKDVAVDAAKEKLDAAKEQEDAAKAAYAAQKAQLDNYKQQNQLIAQQTKLLEQMAKASAGGGGAGGGISMPDPSSLMPTGEDPTAASPIAQIVTDVTNAKAAFLGFKDSVAESMGGVQSAVAPIVTWFTENTNMLGAALAGVGAMIAYAIGPTLATIISGAATAFSGLIVAAAPIIGTFALVAAAGALIYGAWTGTLDEILTKVTSAFGGIISYVTTQLPIWIATLTSWATQAWSWIQAVTPLVLAAIGNTITTLVAYVQTQLPIWVATLVLWAQQASQWIQDALPFVIAAITAYTSTIFGYLADNLPTWIAQLLEWGIQAVQWIADAAPELLIKLGEFLGTLTTWAIGTALPAIVAWGIDAALSMIGWVVTELIPKVAPKMGEFLAELVTALGTVLTGIATAALDIGTGIIDGVKKGISEGITSLTNAVRDAAAAALKAAKSALGIQSPSKVFADEIGKPTAQGWAYGITANQIYVIEAGDELTRALLATTGAAIIDADQLGVGYVSNIIGGIEGKLPDLLASAKGMTDDVKEKLTAGLADVKAKYAEVMRDIATSVAEARVSFNKSMIQALKDVNDLAPKKKSAEQAEKDKIALAEKTAKVIALKELNASETNDEAKKQRIAEIAKLEQEARSLKGDDDLTKGQLKNQKAAQDAINAAQQEYLKNRTKDPEGAAKIFDEKRRQAIELAKLDNDILVAKANGDTATVNTLLAQRKYVVENNALELTLLKDKIKAEDAAQLKKIQDVKDLAATLEQSFKKAGITSIGASISDGIGQGIKSAAGNLKDAIVTSMDGAIIALKAALGIKSPSKVLAEQIGKPMMQGWAQGIEKNTDLLTGATFDASKMSLNAAAMPAGAQNNAGAVTTTNAPTYVINLDLRGSTMSRQDAEKLIDTKINDIAKAAVRIKK